jgi:hypothetical protein
MMMNRTPLVRLALALTLAAACLHAETAAGQVEEPRSELPPSERAFCWQGRPVESCRSFLVAEGGAHLLLGGSRYARNEYNSGRVTRSPHLAGHLNWEIGVLVNRGPAHAVGATVLVGADPNGLRVGVKGRYRRWMGRHTALDLGAGVLATRRAAPFEGAEADREGNRHVVVGGVTGDVALGLTDWASLSLRGDLLADADGSPAHAVYGGLRLGTRPAAVATVTPFILGLGALLLYGAGN